MPADARPRVLHQAGAAHRDAVVARYRERGVAAEVVTFIDDIAARYADTDLIVCRAGATTIAEIAAAGIASVLVPYPHAVDDHQTINARFLADRGAALLIPQHELTPQRLAEALSGLTRERLLVMAQAARAAGKPEATRAVAQVCKELACDIRSHVHFGAMVGPLRAGAGAPPGMRPAASGVRRRIRCVGGWRSAQ